MRKGKRRGAKHPVKIQKSSIWQTVGAKMEGESVMNFIQKKDNLLTSFRYRNINAKLIQPCHVNFKLIISRIKQNPAEWKEVLAAEIVAALRANDVLESNAELKDYLVTDAQKLAVAARLQTALLFEQIFKKFAPDFEYMAGYNGQSVVNPPKPGDVKERFYTVEEMENGAVSVGYPAPANPDANGVITLHCPVPETEAERDQILKDAYHIHDVTGNPVKIMLVEETQGEKAARLVERFLNNESPIILAPGFPQMEPERVFESVDLQSVSLLRDGSVGISFLADPENKPLFEAAHKLNLLASAVPPAAANLIAATREAAEQREQDRLFKKVLGS